MSILDSSPTNNRCFSAEIAEALGDINAAVIVQQLHYWMQKEGVGTMVEGIKFKFLKWKTAQSPEMVVLCASTERGVRYSTLEMSSCEFSYIDSKITSVKETAIAVCCCPFQKSCKCGKRQPRDKSSSLRFNYPSWSK